MELLLGNCLDRLKDLEDNSVDAIVTDPPYGLSFMGKKWDYDVPSVDIWKECLRVLKAGGYLLSFAGTRTQHRMAVNIEDAGFEIRDMIAWVYGSGFPKSLNIGKAVDKLQGNEREVTDYIAPDGKKRWGGNSFSVGEEPDGRGINKATKGTSPWEGWGTALKPALEPITVARKPLGEQELDIAKNICYNITEKGLITNSKIIWRIKNVKNAEQLKTKLCSTQTPQQKMVVISAETVETKENESVGKKIQKLIESICESGIQETGNKQEKQVQEAISKTEIDDQNITKNTNEEEKKKQSLLMEENASVVEKQDLSSLPLTTLEVVEDITEKKSKTETSMSSLKSTDTQKTDTDCSVLTATSQWVCMDIARTIKVSFEGKEYDFDELSDGSLVWNENLEPYRKQQKLNVAENCLKWGVGGINIDGCRVDFVSEEDKKESTTKNQHEDFGTKPMTNNNVYGDYSMMQPKNFNPTGRFPANLIHDGSDEVVELFPQTISRWGKATVGKQNNGFLKGGFNNPNAENFIGDSGNASRFFYCAKASKKERNMGCEGLEATRHADRNIDDGVGGDNPRNRTNTPKQNFHPTVKPLALMEYLVKLVSREGQVILDPFMGSGTTGMACKKLKREFIGIEMSEEYMEIAKARIESATKDAQLNML